MLPERRLRLAHASEVKQAMDNRDERQPLPSVDEGDLVDEPRRGLTDDPLVATEEGVPYEAPYDRVLDPRGGGVDVAGTDDSDAGELERDDRIQVDDGGLPRVTSGDRIRISVTGSRVHVRGEVESAEVLDEILGIVGDVVGVDEVLDEVDVSGQ